MKIEIYTDDIENLFENHRQAIINEIHKEKENQILSVGSNQYIEYFVNKYSLECPEIDESRVVVTSDEQDVIGSAFPNDFDVRPNDYYKIDKIIYEVPYTGNIAILRFKPKQFVNTSKRELQANPNSSVIEIGFFNFRNDGVQIDAMYQAILRTILINLGHLKVDIEKFNANLESFIESSFNSRKQHFLDKRKFLQSLNVPLKQDENVSKTFIIPQPKLRQKIIVKPIASNNAFEPEPALDESNYRAILKIINDAGKNFERLPSVYKDKGEEDLRDHILFVLDPNFQFGSASGETFNKTGKTDIQLRYDSSVVFIAECKFWDGEVAFLDTIDQLLGYLTFRDSKCSVIIFVNRKDISSVLKKVKEAVVKHNNFVKQLPDTDVSWYNYLFSLPEDENKEIQLAVQVYHIPEK